MNEGISSNAPQTNRYPEPMDRCVNAAENVPTALGSNGDNKIRRLVVTEISRGYVVEVGCQTFAIETKAQLISKLSEYIMEPEKTEQKWFKKELF